MRDNRDRSGGLKPGHLVLVGLTLLVLSVVARPFSRTIFDALVPAAGALWLAAVALFARERSATQGDVVRLAAVGIPAALAVAVAFSAAGPAASVVGLAPAQGGSGPAQEQVAGATAAPSGSAARPSAAAAASGSPAAAASPSASPSSSAAPSVGPALIRGRVALRFVSLTSPVQAGDTVTATARTTPGARCTIAVGYLSAADAQSVGLYPQIAPGSGVVTWSWTIGASAPSGSYRTTVTCASRNYRSWWNRQLVIG